MTWLLLGLALWAFSAIPRATLILRIAAGVVLTIGALVTFGTVTL